MSLRPFIPTQVAYIRDLRILVNAQFVELPAFERHRSAFLDDDQYRILQSVLLADPEAGDVVEGTGGLRKLRFGDARRGKGKRGGLRVIYYWWLARLQFWLSPSMTRTPWMTSRQTSAKPSRA